VHRANKARLGRVRDKEFSASWIRDLTPHVEGGSAREGDNRNLIWWDTLFLDKVFEPPAYAMRLASPGTGEQEQWAWQRMERIFNHAPNLHFFITPVNS